MMMSLGRCSSRTSRPGAASAPLVLALLVGHIAILAQAVREEMDDMDSVSLDDDAVHAIARQAAVGPVQEACQIHESDAPQEVLERLRRCTQILQEFAVKTKEGHTASKAANEEYAVQFRSVMALLGKLRDIKQMNDAFGKDQQMAMDFLLQEAGKVEDDIGKLVDLGVGEAEGAAPEAPNVAAQPAAEVAAPKKVQEAKPMSPTAADNSDDKKPKVGAQPVILSPMAEILTEEEKKTRELEAKA